MTSHELAKLLLKNPDKEIKVCKEAIIGNTPKPMGGTFFKEEHFSIDNIIVQDDIYYLYSEKDIDKRRKVGITTKTLS